MNTNGSVYAYNGAFETFNHIPSLLEKNSIFLKS